MSWICDLWEYLLTVERILRMGMEHDFMWHTH